MFWNNEDYIFLRNFPEINRKHEMFWNLNLQVFYLLKYILTVNMKCFEMQID